MLPNTSTGLGGSNGLSIDVCVWGGRQEAVWGEDLRGRGGGWEVLLAQGNV